jgi:hypothetical protein
VASQENTRQLWAASGPFEPYTVHGITQQNVPEAYIKGAVWKTDIHPARYYTQSSAPEESGLPLWYPVKFNEEHVCWVKVRWIEPASSEGYWQAFHIAGEDLGLDITQREVEVYIASTTVTADTTSQQYRESLTSLDTS